MAKLCSQLSFRVDGEEFRQLCGRIMDRVRALGASEAERRLGYSLGELMRRTDEWFDVVPGDDPLVIRIQPSVRFDEVLAALG
jgi:hypothetical protein